MCAENPERGAVVVVDPLSSGALVAAGVLARGFRLVMVFSGECRLKIKIQWKRTSLEAGLSTSTIASPQLFAQSTPVCTLSPFV